MRKALAALLFAALAASALAGCRGGGGDEAARRSSLTDGDWLVGAYYYTWYPRNFRQGTLRARLVPPQEPELGLYDSGDPRNVERQIAWAVGAGVDFLAVGWWPGRPQQNKMIPKSFLKAQNIGDIRFCIFYEAWALGFDEKRGMTLFDADVSKRFVEDLVSFGDKYFGHPSYLRVGGRPVVIVYLTRTFGGEYAKAVAEARERLRAKGHDVFLVADEVFWGSTPADATATSAETSTGEPQAARIRLFDAITSYNMYQEHRPEHVGYGSRSAFLADVAKVYDRYRAAAGDAVYFVPAVMPGYNDRGVRPRLDHHAIPRRWAPDAADDSYFTEMWRRIAVPYADPRLNMVMITTWNEWNEDTGIEPLKAAPATTRDESPTGEYHTQGYAYAGHGTLYLDALRRLTAEKPAAARKNGKNGNGD